MTAAGPKYRGRPIGSVEALALALGNTEARIRKLAENADLLFKHKKKKTKSGKIRDVYDATRQLKSLHEKINEALLRQVDYPEYLQGGLKERDYISDCALHIRAKRAITQDISNFFPSISRDDVKRVWQYFFMFPPRVAGLLAKLTTRKGFIPQGAKTSGFLANLLFWEEEPKLVEAFAKNGLRYSRFVDDITVSTERDIDDSEKNAIITAIRGMFRRHNLRPNRSRTKSRIQTGEGPITVHGLQVDKGKPTKPKEDRKKIRAWIHRLEKTVAENLDFQELQRLAGSVGIVARLHSREGLRLKKQMRSLFDRYREAHNVEQTKNQTQDSRKETANHG